MDSTVTWTDRQVTGERGYLSVSVVPVIVLAFDMLAIAAAALATNVIFPAFVNTFTLDYYVFCVGFVIIATTVLLSRANMYEVDAIMRPVSRSDFLIVALITAFLLFLTIVVTLKAFDIFAKRWLLCFAILSVVVLVASRFATWGVLQRLGRRGVIGRRLVVLGTGEQAHHFLRRLNEINPYFTTVAAVFDTERHPQVHEVEGVQVRGGFEAMLAYARTNRVDDIIVALPWTDDKHVRETLDALRELPINVAISTDLVGYQLAWRPVMGNVSQLPVFEVVQRPISGWSFLLKMAEDYVLTIVCLIVLSPVLIVTAIAIKLDSPGPILFKQRRLGFNNQVFEIYKFRSMHHEAVPATVTKQATKGDPRITRVGRFIRATSIDELPQLLNVLEGNMSLVGPRPHALDHNEDYGRQIRGYFARHKVKPGITGWAQVNGLRGETKALAKMKARVRHDIHYAENWSLIFDLRILAITAFVVLLQRNAY